MTSFSDATAQAQAFLKGQVTAEHCIEQALEQIAVQDPALNCFTAVLGDTASSQAKRLDTLASDALPSSGLAGTAFAAKNLFDIQGLTTRCRRVAKGAARSGNIDKTRRQQGIGTSLRVRHNQRNVLGSCYCINLGGIGQA